MRDFGYFLILLIVTIGLSACGTVEQPTDPTEANYPAPDRISNQENLQELHGDILRNDF